jgi:hypothetical protein
MRREDEKERECRFGIPLGQGAWILMPKTHVTSQERLIPVMRGT